MSAKTIPLTPEIGEAIDRVIAKQVAGSSASRKRLRWTAFPILG